MTKFSDLSLPVRIAIVAGWIYLCVVTLSMLIGFIAGVTGAVRGVSVQTVGLALT